MKDRYPTPDMPEEITFTTRCVPIPDIPEFIALIGGLLFQSTKEHFWDEVGTMTVDQATTAMQDALGMYNAIEGCFMTCEQIIECVENDADTQQALTNYLASQGYSPIGGGGTPNDPSVYTDNPLLIDGSTIDDCDNDNLFGAITQFVDFINRRIVDVFEIIEAETNIIERTQIALEAVPITDTLAADSAAAFADQLVEEIAEGYAAAFTEELEDEYRCDLFCLVKDSCELDFQTFADYFNNRIGNTPPSVQFSEYIEWFITGSFVGSNIVDAAYSLVCAALAYHSSAFGINIGLLLTSINSALNDPNPDWVTLCDDCVDFPIPELNVPCGGGGGAGTSLTHISGTRWSIQTTHRTVPDEAWFIRAVGGDVFRLANINHVAGFPLSPIAAGWMLEDNTCGAALMASAIDPTANNLKEWGFTWQDGTGVHTTEFDMIAPP